MANDSDWFTCTKKEEEEEVVPQLRGTHEQAAAPVHDPYDPTCLAAFLQDPSPDTCTGTMDADGQPCEFCSFQGSISLCLTSDQAAMGEPIGITCDETAAAVQDPYDPSCALAYLQDQSEESCKSAVDSDGNPCEYCTLQGSMNFCLNDEQAQMAEQIGMECDGSSNTAEQDMPEDPYDPSCALAYLQDQSEESCKSAVDSDGNPCEYCTLQGSMNFCLNDEQAQMAEQFGMECDGAETKVKFPSDFFECLQNYDQDGCASNACTWCNTEVGIGFCMADAAANALSQCNFFDCDYKDNVAKVDAEVNQPFDPACLNGMESEDACNATQDSTGKACVWCDAAGVFGLCLSEEGAHAASDYLTCGTQAAEAVVTKVW